MKEADEEFFCSRNDAERLSPAFLLLWSITSWRHCSSFFPFYLFLAFFEISFRSNSLILAGLLRQRGLERHKERKEERQDTS